MVAGVSVWRLPIIVIQIFMVIILYLLSTYRMCIIYVHHIGKWQGHCTLITQDTGNDTCTITEEYVEPREKNH